MVQKAEQLFYDSSPEKFSGFYKRTLDKRLDIIKSIFPEISEKEISLLKKSGSLDLTTADRMIENVIGTISIPLGLGIYFRINDKDYVVPMAVEEPSVIAAASSAAKIVLKNGGFQASTTDQLMIGQIQILNVPNFEKAKQSILAYKNEILKIANHNHPSLVAHGGGAQDIRVRTIETRVGKMMLTEIIADCQDAMGANTMSAMAEEIAPLIEELSEGTVLLRILSNLSDKRLARATCIISKEDLGGEQVVDNIVAACAFAEADPYRAATHNKGIMNGISSVILATANDTRAIEAGAHTYASMKGHYSSLTKWEKTAKGNLKGSIEVPLALGIIGGATKTNPIARISLKIMTIQKASELAKVVAAVGLAQNLGALRALVTTGIIKGHMKLHAKNIAIAAGAKGSMVDKIAKQMIEEEKVKFSYAKELLNEKSS
jgi:hydroxymethylglutaryl-CoA reductase